jgi:serine/threonine protein kinase
MGRSGLQPGPLLLSVGCRSHIQRVLVSLLVYRLLLPSGSYLSVSQNTNFSFQSFNSTDHLDLVGDVQHNPLDSSIQINLEGTAESKGSCGKLLWKEKVRVMDLASGKVASFSTSFSFAITGQDLWLTSTGFQHGDGMAFTFATDNSTLAGGGSCLCLLWQQNNGLPSNQVFAVEFDTWRTSWFDDPSDSHIGVDVNSMNSTKTYNLCGGSLVNCSYLCNGGDFTAWVDYNATGQTLDVRFANGTSAAGVRKPTDPVIRVQNLDLSNVFNEYMYVGFSASTGKYTEVHKIKSWSFTSSGMPEVALAPSPAPLSLPPSVLPTAAPAVGPKSKVALISGVCGAVGALLVLGAFCLCLIRRRRRRGSRKQQAGNPSEIHRLLVPRLFTYKELKRATRDFSESNLLGTGGFGAVYKGTLEPSGALIAVKRIRQESKEGEEGFVAEASSISQIRHRNLVQLKGWCHENGNLMLVYDFMPYGSLDKWIFTSQQSQEKDKWFEPMVLPWRSRHSILAGVASAVAYLHEEWQQCILHRDIKSSNVLLDADFNAYLADFGLARLIDHKKVDKTTLMAGTLGYMAPEMSHTGKATKESDVYSFGILMLEVVCGRRPLDFDATRAEDVVLVDSVWRAHEAGDLLSVADPKLKPAANSTALPDDRNLSESQSPVPVDSNTATDSTFTSPDLSAPVPLEANSVGEDENIVRYLLHLGLLCCNPSPYARPSMRTVNQMLQSDELDALPALPECKPLVQYRMSNASTSSPVDVSFASEASLATIAYINAQGRSRTRTMSEPRSASSTDSMQRLQLGHPTHGSSSSTFTSSNSSTSGSWQMGATYRDP